MCMSILLLVFGLIALVKGEFKITAKRMVKGSVSRPLGVLLLLGAGVPYLSSDYGALIQVVLLVVVIVVGLLTSKKIEQLPEGSQGSSEGSQ